jgi:hypothetical protein
VVSRRLIVSEKDLALLRWHAQVAHARKMGDDATRRLSMEKRILAVPRQERRQP